MAGTFCWDKFNGMPVVAIARNITEEYISGVLPVFVESGLTTIEITMNTTGAKEMIRHFTKAYAGRLNVGAGTVCTMNDLDGALAAGAQFIVTPVTDPEIISTCAARKVPVFPGAFTPTEIFNAWKAGADMVKIFPASVLGAAYIKEIKGPLNQVKLIPTGGISADNCISFLRSGADAVGMGGQLMDSRLIKEKNWPDLLLHFEETVKAIRSFRKIMVS